MFAVFKTLPIADNQFLNPTPNVIYRTDGRKGLHYRESPFLNNKHAKEQSNGMLIVKKEI